LAFRLSFLTPQLLRCSFRSRKAPAAENLFLRKQLALFQEREKRARPKTAADRFAGSGSILAVKSDGTGMQTIVPAISRYMPNNLVFDAHGLYFSVFRGISAETKAVRTTYGPSSGRSRLCSRTSRWRTASPSVRLHRPRSKFNARRQRRQSLCGAKAGSSCSTGTGYPLVRSCCRAEMKDTTYSPRVWPSNPEPMARRSPIVCPRQAIDSY
jgi:hypothetical protein